VCKARKPECPLCVVADLCRYGAKTAPAEMIAARGEAAAGDPLIRPKRRRARPAAR
jgi:adenine-specific DNA glycosylase